MKMTAGKINSILNRQNSAERNLDRKRGILSLKDRVASIKSIVKEQYDQKESEEIISVAVGLLDTYNSPDDIPVNELENSDYDDARLLAFCQVVNEKKAMSN